MSMLLFYGLTAGAALLLCMALAPLVIVTARRWGLVDEPHPRKVHHRPVPTIGGVAIAAAVLLTAGAAAIVHHYAGDAEAAQLLPRQLIVLLAAAAFIFGVGLIDDLRPIPAKYKLLALVAAGAALCGVGVRVDALYTQHEHYLALGMLAWPVTILWVTGMTASVNFIDGLDGLAAGLVGFAAAVLAAMLITVGEPAIAAIALALCAALAGFLVFNKHPAKLFMGDGGSMFIAFILAGCCVLAVPSLGTMKAMILPAAVLSVPILDTALTLFRRRFVERRSLFSAERGHIHHRLLDLGLSQRQAVWLIYGVSAVAGGIAWMALWAEGWASFGVLALLVPLLLGFFRAAGSIRSRDIVEAVRRKRLADRGQKEDQQLFEEMQLHFRQAGSFSEWWEAICRTAESLGFASVEMEVTGRDGSSRALRWRPADVDAEQVETINATVPVRDRRHDQGPLLAKVRVTVTHSLERAGQRLAMFSRLMNEHSLAEIREPTYHGHCHSQGEAADVLSRLVGWNRLGSPTRCFRAGEPAPESRDSPVQQLRVAVTHDFLYVYGGAERVLEQIVRLYPHADLFSLFDFLPEGERGFIANKPVQTTFLQRMPLARTKHRAYLPLMPLAMEQLDLSGYDLVISSSYVAAKSVITGPDQLHVCYCHSPVRSAWDLQHQCLNENNIGYGPRGMLARAILHYIRNWDARSALGVDAFVANSGFVARRIEKFYRREADVVYPPVDTEAFKLAPTKRNYYVTASRLVPYKRIDLIVQAFTRMPERRLVVVGDGPEAKRIASLAGPNVELVGHQSAARLNAYLRQARAFVFAAEEDFGIVPVEAMACGTPVIAFGQGGASESMVEDVTGLCFDRQTPESIVEAVERFEQRLDQWDPAAIRERAEMFAASAFRQRFSRLVDAHWHRFAAERQRRGLGPADAGQGVSPAAAVPAGAQAATDGNGEANGGVNGETHEHAETGPDGASLPSPTASAG